MDLRFLTAPTMLAVSGPMIDPRRNRPKFEAHEALRAPLKALIESHERLYEIDLFIGTLDQQVRELTDKLTLQDAIHDRLARAIHGALTAAIDLVDTSDEAAPFVACRDTLFPIGLSITQRTYRDQTGTAEKVAGAITADDRTLLAAIVFDGRSLLDAVDAWLGTAAEMGILQNKRAELAAQGDPDTISRGDIHQARLDWIRAIQGLLNNLSFTNMSEKDQAAVFASLREAVADAAEARKRAEAARNKEAAEEPTADNPSVPEPA